MPSADDVMTTLRTLDPARPAGPGHRLDDRARADLARILATDPQRPAGPPPARRRCTGRLAAGGATVVAATSLLLLAPSLTGGDRAFATWTAEPDGLSAEASREAVAGCTRAQLDGPGASYAAQLAGATTRLADTRGVWTTVYLADGAGFSALCVTDGSTRVLDDWIGSIGSGTDRVAPGPRELVATDLGTGTLSAGDISLAAGAAGADVAAVRFESLEHGTVSATVADGAFALWLPGDDLEDTRGGVEVEVTYRDGTTGTARLAL